MKGTPYSAYKPSGIDWLGAIPAHWDVRRLKSVCRFAYGDTLTAEMRNDGDVPVYGSNGQVGIHSATNTWAPCIVIGRKGSFGKVNFVEQPAFAIDTTYFVDERHSQNDLRWLFYLLGWLRLDDVTKDSAIPGLGREDAYQRLVPVPPLNEQAAIVRYLDRADERIQRAISAKERLIELLTEQRQAVICHAVTHGLDPDVRLKDSGVEWLGEVPEHWGETTTVKRHFKTQLGKMLQSIPLSSDDIEVPYLKAQHVHWNHVRVENPPTMWATPKEVEQFGIQRGDLLIVEGGVGGVTNSAILEDTVDGYIIQNALHRVRPRGQASNRFLLSVLMAIASSGWFNAINNKATMPHFTKEKLNSLPIPFPPISERAAIVHHLDKATTAIDAALGNAQRQIDLLREYRTRLIADAVTGCVDVQDGAL